MIRGHMLLSMSVSKKVGKSMIDINIKPPVFLSVLIFICSAAVSAQQQITINTEPQGAGVYYDGNRIGTTPLVIDERTPNAPDFCSAADPVYNIIIAKDFYETEFAEISLKGSPEITFPLNPLPRLPFYDGVFLNNEFLRISDVFFKDLDELTKLREEIYARYGRPIEGNMLKLYFLSTRWYKENPLYTEDMLTDADKFNIRRINDFLVVNDDDAALFNAIIKQYEFFTKDRKYSIRFINSRECMIAGAKYDEISGNDGVVPYFFEEGWIMSFIVAEQEIYISDPAGESISTVKLDLGKKQLINIELIEDVYYRLYW